MFGDMFAQVSVLGGLVYGLVEVFKPIWDKEKRENLGDRIGAAVFGVGICLGAGFDIFPVVGFELQVPYVGQALTGILVVGGAKGIHDILGFIDATRVARNNGAG